MTTQTQPGRDVWDVRDAEARPYEALLMTHHAATYAEERERAEAEAREAMYRAEVSGDDRPLWWRRLSGALVVLAAAGVALTAVIQIGRALHWLS